MTVMMMVVQTVSAAGEVLTIEMFSRAFTLWVLPIMLLWMAATTLRTTISQREVAQTIYGHPKRPEDGLTHDVKVLRERTHTINNELQKLSSGQNTLTLQMEEVLRELRYRRSAHRHDDDAPHH